MGNVNWTTVGVSVAITLAGLYLYHHYVMKAAVVPAALAPAA